MNTKNAQKLVKVAAGIASLSDHSKQFRHVSIIIQGKSIVGIGMNGYKTHSITAKAGYRGNLIHSEIDAYSKIRHRIGSFVLVNFRFNRKGDLRNSMPCKYCLPWCLEVFDEIWYSTDDGMSKMTT